ncbi:MAG: DUF4407 domain-containing protein [Methylococcaceae bacterium]
MKLTDTMRTILFRIFSYGYGNHLATWKVIVWLISINLAVFFMAGVEIYTWTDVIKDHVSDNTAVTIIIGSIVGVLVWILDQSLISVDFNEFKKSQQNWKFYTAIGVRVLIFSIAIFATQPLLVYSFDKNQGIQAIDQHNRLELAKINTALDKQFEQEKQTIIKQIADKEKEIKTYENTLLSKKASVIYDKKYDKKSKRSNITILSEEKATRNSKTGELAKNESCNGKACDETRLLLSHAEKELTALKTELENYTLSERNKRHVPISANLEADINNVLINYCSLIRCDFWNYDTDSIRKATANSIERPKINFLLFSVTESQLIAGSFMTLIFATFLGLKILEPEDVKIYYDAVLQENYARYQEGFFDARIDEKERYQSPSPMGAKRFYDWYYKDYLPNKDTEVQESQKIEARQKLRNQLTAIKDDILEKEQEKQKTIEFISSSEPAINKLSAECVTCQNKINLFSQEIKQLNASIDDYKTKRQHLEDRQAEFAFRAELTRYAEDFVDPIYGRNLRSNIVERNKIQKVLNGLEEDKIKVLGEINDFDAGINKAKHNMDVIQERLKSKELAIDPDEITNLVIASKKHEDTITQLNDKAKDYHTNSLVIQEAINNKTKELKELSELVSDSITDLVNHIGAFSPERKQEAKAFLESAVGMNAEQWQQREQKVTQEINALTIKIDELLTQQTRIAADLSVETEQLKQREDSNKRVIEQIASYKQMLFALNKQLAELLIERKQKEQQLRDMA